MSSKITFNCDWCNKEVSQYPSRYYDGKKDKGHFCSHQCFAKWKSAQNSISIICSNCGKEFTLTKHRYEQHQENSKSGKLFCSKKCFQESELLRRKTGKNVTFNCEQCGKEVTQWKSNYEQAEHHFCSRECKGKWKHEHVPYVNLVCDFCGVEFSIRESYYNARKKSNKDDKFYCSADCVDASRRNDGKGENRKMYTGLWRTNRKRRLEKDNHTCQLCKKSQDELDILLHVHHLIPANLFDNFNQAHRIDNLITLCARCHNKVEGYSIKKANHEIYR